MDGKAWILIVDDEESVLGLMATVLKLAGHRVSIASDAADALSLCRFSDQAPDLLLTDVLLHPAFTGCELAKHLRLIHPGLPVLYVSGLSESEMVAEEVRRHSAAFLTKPFSPRQLADSAANALRLRHLAVT